MASYSKNIATDFGWTVGSDASLAWDSFETWRTANMVAGDSVTLTGALATYTFARSGGGSGKKLAPGMLGGVTIIHDFPVGTIFSDGGTGGSGFFLGGTGMYEDDVHSSRINTVLAGHNTVTLKTSGEATRFTVGQYVIVTGCCQQIGGSPINPAFFDLLKITNITGAVITLDGAITHDLLDTWPLYFAGDSFTPDDGGPATIYALHTDFDVNAYYNGITFDEDYQIYANGKFLQFNNCGCTPSRAGIIPSLNKRMNFISFTGPTSEQIEVDKLVEELLYLNCTMHSLKFQSAGSVKRCTIIDSTVYNVNGTPSELIMLRSTMGTADGGINMGALAHGATKLIRADNCVLPLIFQAGVSEADIVGQGFTMTSGVIRWDPANSDNPSWCTPGSNLHIVGTGAHAPLDCTVTSLVRENSTTIAAHTTATGGFPGTDSTLTLRVHPCPVHVGTGNTGTGADSVGFNDNQGDPLFFGLATPNSYLQFTGGGGGGTGTGTLLASNLFGVDTTVVDPADYYIPGAYTTAISTADYYGIDGLYCFRPYDLTTMGTLGATAAAAGGGRYYWMTSADHPTGSVGASWADGMDFRAGFSHDPGVPPDELPIQAMVTGNPAGTANTTPAPYNLYPFSLYQGPVLLYCPEDTGHEFHMFSEGADYGGPSPFTVTGTKTDGSPIITGISDMTFMLGSLGPTGDGTQLNGTGIPANSFFVIDSATQITLYSAATGSGSVTLSCINPETGHCEGMARSADLFSWTPHGPTHWNFTGGAAWSSLGRPIRNGSGDYEYLSLNYHSQSKDGKYFGDTLFTYAISTSTDGLTFTRPDPPDMPFCAAARITLNGITGLGLLAWDPIVIAGVKWLPCSLDGRFFTITLANPAVITKPLHGLAAGDTIALSTTKGAPYTGNTVSGSPIVTGMGPGKSGVPAMEDTLFVGCAIKPTGSLRFTDGPFETFGIPAGTTIVSIDSSTQITMSHNATFTGSNGIVGLTLPAPILPGVPYYVLASGLTADTFQISDTPGGTPFDTSGSSQYVALGGHYVPDGGMYVARVAVDDNYVVQTTPAPIILATYPGNYPGPEYLQATSCFYNPDDGIAHYYMQRGFFMSTVNFEVTNAPYVNGGALQQQMIDYLVEIVDPVAAAAASPVGLRASCNSGTVTITWYHAAQPGNTYRLYKGSTDANPAHITTLVGDVASGTATDTPTADTRWWYRLVKLNAGTEAGERIIDVWASSASAFVNKHILRAKKGGATDIDKAYLQACYQWMIDKGYFGALEKWVNPTFGQIKDGSNIVSKTWDLGATRKSFHGDVEFCKGTPGVRGTSTTTYSATGLSSHPAWTAGNTNSYMVFGGLCDANNQNGRLNPLRRLVEVTMVACYAKSSSSGDSALMAMGEFGGISLSHLSGSPGTVQFQLSDDVATGTAAVSLSGSATARHVIAGTFGLTGNLLAYADSTAGSPSSTSLHTNADLALLTTLKGQTGSGSQVPFLNSGSKDSKFGYGTTTSTYGFDGASTTATISDLIVFSKEMSATDLASLQTLLTTRAYP